ncbi:hypothetical protein P4123_12460 [Pseudomonas aeruginosa]|nr:hypothetical protein [Pseudomonas aeruginosa]
MAAAVGAPLARADDEPTLGEICAADYVGRGYMAENHRPHDLRFNRGPTPTPWRPSPTLVFSGTYIGYLPDALCHHLSPRRMKAIRPATGLRLEFHCITRQGHEERPTLTCSCARCSRRRTQLGVWGRAPANTNGTLGN